MDKFVLEGKYQSQRFGVGDFRGLLIRDGGLITAQMHDNRETAHRYALGGENVDYLWFLKFPPREEDGRLAPLLYVSNVNPTRGGVYTGRALPINDTRISKIIYDSLPEIYQDENIDRFHSRMRDTANLDQTLAGLAKKELQRRIITEAPIITNLRLDVIDKN